MPPPECDSCLYHYCPLARTGHMVLTHLQGELGSIGEHTDIQYAFRNGLWHTTLFEIQLNWLFSTKFYLIFPKQIWPHLHSKLSPPHWPMSMSSVLYTLWHRWSLLIFNWHKIIVCISGNDQIRTNNISFSLNTHYFFVLGTFNTTPLF
jgi:hypothetical protein